MVDNKHLQSLRHAQAVSGPRTFLSRKLMKMALVSFQDAASAEATAIRRNLPLGDVYHACYAISRLTIATILSEQFGAQKIDPLEHRPEKGLIQSYGPTDCLAHHVLPWRRIGDVTIVLTTLPEHYEAQRNTLEGRLGPTRMAFTTEEHLANAVTTYFGRRMVHTAETRVPSPESCRNWNAQTTCLIGIALLASLIYGMTVAPQITFAILAVWTILVLLGTSALRATAAFVAWRDPPPEIAGAIPKRLPVISVLVPLHRETAIAAHLLSRLKDVDYPRELLDICLVLEGNDVTTRAALGQTSLPTWIRAITVPEGTIKTKPLSLIHI